MTALIDPTRHGVARHRRIVDDATDDVGVPVVDGWLDPATAPLAVYRDRDLPYAPLAVQRDRARVVAAAPMCVPTPRAPRPAAPPPPPPPPPPAPVGPDARRIRAAVLVAVGVLVVLAGVVVALLAAGPPSPPGGGPAGTVAVERGPIGH